jgi:hypothetical protein
MNPNPNLLSDIVQALHLEELNAEDQEAILLDIHELILTGTITRVTEQMDEKTRDEFEVLLESSASEEEIESFIARHVPHADKAMEEAIAELTSDILLTNK